MIPIRRPNIKLGQLNSFLHVVINWWPQQDSNLHFLLLREATPSVGLCGHNSMRIPTYISYYLVYCFSSQTVSYFYSQELHTTDSARHAPSVYWLNHTVKLVGRIGVTPISHSPLLCAYLFSYHPKLVRVTGNAPALSCTRSMCLTFRLHSGLCHNEFPNGNFYTLTDTCLFLFLPVPLSNVSFGPNSGLFEKGPSDENPLPPNICYSHTGHIHHPHTQPKSVYVSNLFCFGLSVCIFYIQYIAPMQISMRQILGRLGTYESA